MTDWATVVMALAALVLPLACAYIVVQRLARQRSEAGDVPPANSTKKGGTGMTSGA
jgi:hypothetical protein